ncbi:cytidylyltransferase domain-containing protein [Thermodesulfobacteriota bacterium]
MKVIAIIPARGGSKSIPLKNIKTLCGKPLLEYTIETSLQADSVDRIVVTTDHEGIAGIARKFKIDVIIRPPELATDEVPTELALLHVLDELWISEKYEPDIVLTLEPTSPFRTPDTIDKCIDIFVRTDADSVIGVVETRDCYGRIINNHFKYLFPGQPRRRQDRDPLFKESSTIWGTRVEVLKKKRSVLGDRLYPLIIPKKEAIDINNSFDLQLSEALMARIRKNEKQL